MKKLTIKTIGSLILLLLLSMFLWIIIFTAFTPKDHIETYEPFPGAVFLCALLTVVVVGFIMRYNQICQIEASIGAGLSNIEVTEKRNKDLMYKANRLIDKHRDNERQELLDFAKASGKETNSSEKMPLNTKVESSKEFGRCITEIPELKANQNVQQLLNEIIISENKLQNDRLSYNELVEEFNTQINQLPLILIKGVTRLKTKEYYLVKYSEEITDEMLGL